MEEDGLHLVGWQLGEETEGYEDGGFQPTDRRRGLYPPGLQEGDGALYTELAGQGNELRRPVFRWVGRAVATEAMDLIESAGEPKELSEETGQPDEGDKRGVGVEIVARELH